MKIAYNPSQDLQNDQEIVALCIGLEDVDKRLIKDSFIVIVDEELLEEISVTYSSMWSNLRGDKNWCFR